MRRSRTISPTAAAVEFVPRDYFAPLDVLELFRREAPLEVDIGCGDGSYLAALAQKTPGHNFLGLERLAGRVRSACKAVAQRQLDNTRVLLIDASYAVAYLLPEECVTTFHILFPDPWPKRRHQRRRVLDQPFFEVLARALVTRGVIRVATDQRDYFEQIRDEASPFFLFENARTDSLGSTFQRRYEQTRAPIYRLWLRKISDLR